MKRAIEKHWRDFAALVGLALIAVVVGGVILGHQRLYLPKSVPFLGSDFVSYKAELATAQSITPGQGQTVNVAGVPVGELSRVDLENGRAVVTMRIRRKYTPIYRDATILVRPKTGLNDMILELTPGSRSSGELAHGATVPVSQTLPNVNADEILAALDGDTRAYLQLLIGGGGEGLAGKGGRLSADLRRLEPTARDAQRITSALAKRRTNIRHAIHNFSALSHALGGKDRQLAELVDSSDPVFATFAREDARIREALRLLPGTLDETNTALAKATRASKRLGPTLGALRPTARALAPAQKATRKLFHDTTPVIRTQLRPFARDALPTAKLLRPAAADLSKAMPGLVQVFKVVNYLLNTLAYNAPGPADEGYLYWLAWANHDAASVFATQDAHGPIRHGVILFSCSTLGVLDTVRQVNPQIATLLDLLNGPVFNDQLCPRTSQSGSGKPPPAFRSADAPVLAATPQPHRTAGR